MAPCADKESRCSCRERPYNRKEIRELAEGIHFAIIQATRENADLKGTPAIAETSVADAARDA